MPELPEVETMRRGVAAILGSRIVEAERFAPDYQPITISPDWPAFRRRLRGKRIIGLSRAGKRVVLELTGDDRLVIEPRMTGLLLVADPPNEAHLRLTLTLRDGPVSRLLYWDRRGLGHVRLLSIAEFEQRFGPEQLGPDALEITSTDLRERLRASRRAIKVALLDQRAVAGIGNLYASEILHLAQVHPERRCDQLTVIQWQRVHIAMYKVLHEAILYEGSTLSDGTYRNALNQSGGYQNEHRVYDRAGAVCRSCRASEIVRIVQAQRSTFFCPQCQPKRGASRPSQPR
jgi:formamidopyrimidine-DNA glycosylase